MAPELGLNHHSNCNICLLKDVQVLRVEDVSDASHDIPVLLINLKHLSCSLWRGVTEHWHLQRDLINFLYMLLYAFNPVGQY